MRGNLGLCRRHGRATCSPDFVREVNVGGDTLQNKNSLRLFAAFTPPRNH